MPNNTINFDFTSLYPNVMKQHNINPKHLRTILRKAKIKKLFNLEVI